MRRSRHAIADLDGVRAIAILLVVARHGVNPFWSSDGGLVPVLGWDLAIPLTNGWMGVDLFFVLSGFLITHQVLRRYGDGFASSDIGDYLRRRMFRIVPAYVATIAIALSGVVPFFEVRRDLLSIRVGYHLLFLQDYLPSDIVVAFWSLGVEEKFYLVAPLVLLGAMSIRSRRRRYALLVGLALAPIVFRAFTARANPGLVDYQDYFPIFRSPFHVTYDGLAVGVLVAFVHHDQLPNTRRSGRTGARLLLILGTLVFGALLFGRAHLDVIGSFDRIVLQAALAWSGGLIVAGLVLGTGSNRVLASHSMFVISKLAYPWYLVHLLFVPMALRVADALVGTGTGATPAPALLRLAVFAPVYVVASLAAASVLHYGVEKPFIELRDRRHRPPARLSAVGEGPQRVATPG